MGVISTIFGFLKIAGGFLKPYWKYIVIVVALVGAYVYAKNKWTDYRDNLIEQSRVEGYNKARDDFKTRIGAANDENAKKTEDLADLTDDYKDLQKKKSNQRVVKETEYKTNIKKIFIDRDGTTCDLPQEVIDNRNAIRALGPNGE